MITRFQRTPLGPALILILLVILHQSSSQVLFRRPVEAVDPANEEGKAAEASTESEKTIQLHNFEDAETQAYTTNTGKTGESAEPDSDGMISPTDDGHLHVMQR